MAGFRSWTSYRVFLGLCLVLTVVLLSTNIYFSFDNNETPFDDVLERVDVFQWSKDSDGIKGKETDDKIFSFLEVDENWNERYSEGGLILVTLWFNYAIKLTILSRGSRGHRNPSGGVGGGVQECKGCSGRNFHIFSCQHVLLGFK